MLWKIPFELQERQIPLKYFNRRPNPVDLSESWVINDDLAIGLYQGSYPGLKLASALTYPIVFVPVSFMGLPIPKAKSKDPKTQEMLDAIMASATTTLQRLFLLRRIVGTSWIWPNWDAKNGRIYHELIPNASVVDIIRSIDSGEVLQIITEEQITVKVAENQTSVITRKRYFTATSVRVEYTGDVPANLVNRQTRNPSGIMPIPFANDVLDNSIRGQSVFGRLLSDLKNYHDTDLKWTQTLVKFNVKMVQSITAKPADWFEQNPQFGDADSFDIEKAELLMNKHGEEETEFVFPEAAMTEAFEKKLGQNFYKIVQGSGVPEMAFGLVTTGNHASAEEQMTTLANTVRDDQTQIDAPIHEYFAACLRLMAGATMTQIDPEFDHGWNDLEVVSQDTKAKIFQMFSDGVSKLAGAAAMPLETQHKLFLMTYPKATEADFEAWRTGLDKAAKYKQFQTATYIEALDAEGSEE
jgi:hypothetical protein